MDALNLDNVFIADEPYIKQVDRLYNFIKGEYEDASIMSQVVVINYNGNSKRCACITIESINKVVYTDGSIAYIAPKDRPDYLEAGITAQNGKIDLASLKWLLLPSSAFDNLDEGAVYDMVNSKGMSSVYYKSAEGIEKYGIQEFMDLYNSMVADGISTKGNRYAFVDALSTPKYAKENAEINAALGVNNSKSVVMYMFSLAALMIRTGIASANGTVANVSRVTPIAKKVEVTDNNGINVSGIIANPDDDDANEEYASALDRYINKNSEKIKASDQYFKDQMDIIYDTTCDMCDYIKDGTRPENRIMCVSGEAGTGKTYSILKALKDKGFKKGIDFIYLRNKRPQPEELYKLCYQYNGKIMILDDVPNLFNTAPRIAFWKAIGEKNSQLDWPGDVSEFAKKTGVYNPVGLNSRDKFYKELGISVAKDVDTIDDDGNKINDVPFLVISGGKSKPSSFNYTGCIILITNQAEEDIESQMTQRAVGCTEADWDAIKRRVTFAAVRPNFYTMWKEIKSKIVELAEDPDVPDEEKIIPPEYVDEVIDEVEKDFNIGLDLGYDRIKGVNYGTFIHIGEMIKNIDRKPNNARKWKIYLQSIFHVIKTDYR